MYRERKVGLIMAIYYKFTDEAPVTMQINGRVVLLHRIQCIHSTRSWYGIKSGDEGGLIETPYSLSKYPIAYFNGLECFKTDEWVYDNAIVCGNPYISNCTIRGNAIVCDNATVIHSVVEGNASISGDAIVSKSTLSGKSKVSGYAKISESNVYDNATITDNAIVERYSSVSGNAKICGDAKVRHSVAMDNVIICGTATVENISIVGNRNIVGTKNTNNHRYTGERRSDLDYNSFTERSCVYNEMELDHLCPRQNETDIIIHYIKNYF